MIEFRIDPRSPVPPFMQIVQQVRQALRLGLLEPDDQLPTVREVAGSIAINPNTVLKAYRELEHEGLCEGRPGQGTFVIRSLTGASLKSLNTLRRGLEGWIAKAQAEGLDDDHIEALMDATLRSVFLAREDSA